MQKGILVLNADLSPLHRVDLHHAIRMLHRGIAEIHEEDEGKTYGCFVMPKILRLVKYIFAKWALRSPKFTKRGIFARDKGICAYCGGKAETIDHVIPRCLNGQSTWKNCVASCRKCNLKKGRKMLKDCGMKLLITPYVPSYEEFFGLVTT